MRRPPFLLTALAALVGVTSAGTFLGAPPYSSDKPKQVGGAVDVFPNEAHAGSFGATHRQARLSLNTESYLDRFIDYPPYISNDITQDLWSPTRNTDGTESFYAIGSKWQQPRQVTGTTPHQGVDASTPFRTSVYPIEAGWIVYQSGRYPDGSCCFGGETAGTAKWEMMIEVDWDYDGVQNDGLFIKYDHLERVGFLSTGSFASAGTKVAESGNENTTQPIHLHFGFIYPREGTTNNGRWTGMRHFYTFASAWDYGRQVDYISQWYLDPTNDLSFFAYITSDGVNTSLSTADVTVLHRAAGTTTWQTLAVRGEFDPHAFRASLNGLGYAPGSTIQFIMRALRPGMADPHNASFFPPRFGHPNNDPNAAASAYPYYTATAQ